MDSLVFFELLFVCFFSFATLFLVRKVARRLHLVDKPSSRKLHIGNIPLAGGISICITISYFVFSNHSSISEPFVFLYLMIALTFVGALDDKFDLSVKVRLLIQCLVAVLMMYHTGNQLQSLGDLFGFGHIDVSYASYILTIVAVIASINAFNMVDGVDGLLGSLSIVTFSSILVLALANDNHSVVLLSAFLIAAIVPYLFMNLGVLGRERKVFMGDAGSMLIGFSVIWMLVSISQPQSSGVNNLGVRPVTALWIIAIPLMDMVAIMLRRVKRGASPFEPDREHLHHIFQRLGLSSIQTTSFIFFISGLLATIGVISDYYKVPDFYMFYSFVFLFTCYYLFLSNVWKISAFLRGKFGLFSSLKSQQSVAQLNLEGKNTCDESAKVIKKAS
ncbi:undecaprenyl-phosphate alpha-N-acetylglucosaminyl 1-phosphate transferase [Pseudoalteromonas phenolica]|uniref:UDP-N-acetylglucosamine--undecaprenyl-phosphate N-acetylglucosaminephosphotransferase n=1 Tax=Pseudoalteromonas phenolica TaxID=161398 RepID=UPI00110BD544|nr:UDP-N-acetylglucosamine--undecaprenyl-phosphate N-acetylglucosaminephosphotransferase [Pseudoalteromonas phenolica]TMN92355.1 undecaprenyl-phosphate alpha-N-acetylglucosaminyl 1-phosphate transferase [Pseudoalteromonas phenolica]